MAYRTLEELGSIVSARLGFGSRGATLGANATLIRSFLQNGQYQLYWMQDWKKLQKWEDVPVGMDQYLVDYPAAANEERILKMAIDIGQGGFPNFQKLEEGIEIDHYNTQSVNSYPKRYERYEQIEVWPKCDQVRNLRIWYVKKLDRFTENADRPLIDDEMILLHATSAGKSHYRQPDAPSWASQLDALLSRIRGTAFGNKRFYAAGTTEFAPPPRPVVVS